MQQRVPDVQNLLKLSIELIENDESNLDELKSIIESVLELLNNKDFSQIYENHKTELRVNSLQNKIKAVGEIYSNDLVVLEILKYLPSSVSLSKSEKFKVLDAIPRLEGDRLSELLKIFEEEYQKFKELEGEFEEDVKKLKEHRESEGAIVRTKDTQDEH